MRRITFFILPPIGTGESLEQGTVADLLEAVPYLLSSGVIPPLRIVNDLLTRGIWDSGMSGGCRWEPFEITQPEWEELVESLSAGGARRFVEPPDSVTCVDDWHAWVVTIAHGYPDQLIELNRECRELEKARAKALSDGDQSLVEELHLRVIEAGNRLAEFMERSRGRG